MPGPPPEPPDMLPQLDDQSILARPMHVYVSSKLAALQQTQRVRTLLAECQLKVAEDNLERAFRRYGIRPPKPVDLSATRAGTCVHLLDMEKKRAFSQLIRASHMKLADFVRLLRGETAVDPRPNKSLVVPKSSVVWESYPHKEMWRCIVENGVNPQWQRPLPRQSAPPKNHKSAHRALNAVVKGIRKGQEKNQYLVLDLDLFYELDGIFCSPFGAVQKGDASLNEDARIIHDLSFPANASVNDSTAAIADVTVSYDGPRALAERILESEVRHPGTTEIMSGDVSGAYRHVPINADHVGKFAGTIPELKALVIDLSCPFGWALSPTAYWIAGGAINHLHSRRRPDWEFQPSIGRELFDGKVWCDDHNCIEPNIGTRLGEANISLRSAMIEVLGPSACNDEKFTQWSRCAKALGLIWDLDNLNVSMPTEKITKAQRRLGEFNSARSVTKTKLNTLIGTLRHVITCIPMAKAFVQRLSMLQREAPPFGAIAVPPSARDDVLWLLLILRYGQLNHIPLQRFTATQAPSIRLFMDASDQGLCALFPDRQEYLQVQFDDEERHHIEVSKFGASTDFGINIRELMSAVFASLVWGHHWKQPHDSKALTHVVFMIDNTSAVAWNNKRFSRNPFAQLALRLLALVEVEHLFYATAEHIPGAQNHAADAGSRVWESTNHAATFTNLCPGWRQVVVPRHLRKLSEIWERCCDPEHWRPAHKLHTTGRGSSGPIGV